MKTQESLKEIERRAYRSTFEDGIYDILFGMVFLILALVPVLELIGITKSYGYLAGIIIVLFPWLAKRYITIPRLGAVTFGPKRKSKKLLLVLICATILLLIMPVLIMMAAEGISGGQLWIAVGPIVALLIALAAYFLDYPRLYLYALVLVYGILQAEFLNQYVGRPLDSLLSFGIAGAVILIFGLALLFRFMKKYPKPIPEVSHVNG